ncbi:MAG TPA: outer membrane protein assembly factor BamC [Methylococcaceae bacterium]|jgi:outer membrane protein assembly factor BamC|nr:outer membrane protein assembly factor BamC [Methylococcaceae bacterium]HIB63368.1 outer membrane protein assembly factor BamC [Methylococcaceae bacterium]HIN68067.1 outer membrane protein assembly factor BamC [Methylococcales bacterium]HIO12913.1 outer membrane protein assembly factor BamC [Methylococcales bacterium]HIO45442.1 outer membrane protein assembly factor BamC [Methylococcales bacterium]
MLRFESLGAVVRWRLLLLMTIIIVSGCTRIKTYFPDKQIDYRHSTELPVLEIPVDLRNNELERQIAEVKRAAKIVETTTGQSSGASPEQQGLPLTQVVRLVSYTGGSPRLEIAKSYDLTWRIVGKALIREGIEIVARNQANAVYFIQYDWNKSPISDGSLWDEFDFVFGEDPTREQEYQIRVFDSNGQSDIMLLDKNADALPQHESLPILKILEQAIKEDLADE